LSPYPDGIPTIPSVKDLGAWAPFCRTNIGAKNPCHRSMAGGMSASFDGIASDAFASITDDGGGRYSGSGYQGRFDLTYPVNDFANTSFNEFMNGATFGGWGWTSVGSFFDMTDAILEGNWGNAAITAIGIIPAFKALKAGGKAADNIVEGVFGRATAGAAQAVRLLQTGGRTMNRSTARALNDALGKSLKPRDWGRALERLKDENLLPGDHHGQIWSDGTYADRAGNLIDNITGYLP
jgi:hypothetical protein